MGREICRNAGGDRCTRLYIKRIYPIALYPIVSIDDLARRVAELAERARKHAEVFRRSEAATRASLIEPFLRLWGWNTEDPAQVRPEFPTQSGRPDYALLGDDGRPLMFVGAKPYGRQEDLTQYISYCVSEGVGYFVATDGVVWEVYYTLAPRPLPEKLVTRWDILRDPPIEVLRKSFAIARGAGERQEAPRPPTPHVTLPTPHVTLASMSPSKFKPPFTAVFPDGQRYGVKKWNELLASVVDWLIKTGRLTERQLPLRTPRSTKRYLANTRPKHPAGHDFKQPKMVSGVYVETHFSAKDIKRMACFALREFGVAPEGVVLEAGS